MRPYLKPTRSDPTLLSSYGDDAAALLKQPYHHLRNVYAGSGGATSSGAMVHSSEKGSGKGMPGAPCVSATGMPTAAVGSPAECVLDQALLEEVVGLDLF